jgi:precorrin-6B C5,15-methyltransferase / cobalt-precorrin-6B C5,C15-methyltransferase
MTGIHVIGIGLDGTASLTDSAKSIIERATLLVGSTRHLSYFPDHPADRHLLSDFHEAIRLIRQRMQAAEPSETFAERLSENPSENPSEIVVLTSGDPLFFGLGRLLLAELPPESLTFHPHLSSIQLAFSRIKQPWQDARLVSVHGRSLEELVQALQQGVKKIAVLTDGTNTPQVIARLLLGLDLPGRYRLWVCENLGGDQEQVQSFTPDHLPDRNFAALNVVILLREANAPQEALNLQELPMLGIPDHHFLSFSDRPGLMTKREVRILALGELALQPKQVIWDIGAGTGSVSIEMARLFPKSQIYAIEQTAAGVSLIQQNSQRFQVHNVAPIHGKAPMVLETLPPPDRIFIGGSGGNLVEILQFCCQQLSPQGVLVIALATLEHLTLALDWLQSERESAPLAEPTPEQWQHHLLQVQLARSIPVGSLTRFAPLNPVTLLTLTH